MGAKALYIDECAKIIARLKAEKDDEALDKIERDRNEYIHYSHQWPRADLDEFIASLNITDDKYNMEHNKRKISFWDDGKEYEIVCAIGARYFRVRTKDYIDEKGVKHGGVYVNLDLKEPKLTKGLEGKAAKADRNMRTHFKMIYRKKKLEN
ncbi:hypothetical protein IJT93_00530 [bacterium]|nr:hypothetical protein [bacterium]